MSTGDETINKGQNTSEHGLIFRVERKTEALVSNKPVYTEGRQQLRFTENFGTKMKSNTIVYPISTFGGQITCTFT